MKFFIIFWRLYRKYKDTFDGRYSRDEAEAWINTFDYVARFYSWNAKHGYRLSDPALDISIMKDRLEESKRSRKHLNDFYTEQKARFEQELIHLKDLIQEKNMVIDRLIKAPSAPPNQGREKELRGEK